MYQSQSGPAFQIPVAARGAHSETSTTTALSTSPSIAMMARRLFSAIRGNGNHWLLVNLVGSVSNRDGIGAKLRLVTEDGAERFSFVSTAGSYLSASDKRAHFGLGSSKKIKLLEITWPSGKVQSLEAIAANQILTVHEPAK